MRRTLTCRLIALSAWTFLFTNMAQAQTPQPVPEPTAEEYGNQPVAYVNGTTPITRAQLGEYLIQREGAERLEKFVNRIIILQECQRRGISVTKAEIEAELDRNIKTLGIPKKAFFETVLARYDTTPYEYLEDVVKPQLLMTKLCSDRVKVDEADLQRQYEREFGEQRRVQIIMWPKKDDMKSIMKQYAKIRESQEEFDSAARNMANPALAASLGHIEPIRRHVYAKDKQVETTAFALKVGEISELIDTEQGTIVMKLHEIIPAQTNIDVKAEQDKLYKQAYDDKLAMEMPKYFAQLREQAKPTILFKGPSEWQYIIPELPPAEGRIIKDIQQVEKE